MRIIKLCFFSFAITLLSACSTNIEGVWINEKYPKHQMNLQKDGASINIRDKGKKKGYTYNRVHDKL